MRKQLALVIMIAVLITGCTSNNSEIESMENEIKDLKYDLKDAFEKIISQEDELAMKDQLLQDAAMVEDKLSFANEQVLELEKKIIDKETEFHQRLADANSRIDEFLLDMQDGRIASAIRDNVHGTYQMMTIIGYGDISKEEKNVLNISSGENASLTIAITGKLYNLKVEYIIWNEDADAYEVDRVVCEFPEISNTDVLFASVLAEGLPSELLTWEDAEGKKFYYLIGDTNMSGEADPVIIVSATTDLNPWWEK